MAHMIPIYNIPIFPAKNQQVKEIRQVSLSRELSKVMKMSTQRVGFAKTWGLIL